MPDLSLSDSEKRARIENGVTSLSKNSTEQITVRFQSETGDTSYSPMSVPCSLSNGQLLSLLKAQLPPPDNDNDDDPRNTPYSFFLNGGELEINENLNDALVQITDLNREKILDIVFRPQAVFKVRPVTRCSSTLSGHTQPVIITQFSADGKHLASGSGDNTVRLWDTNTETPSHTCKGHSNYVLALAWSPDTTKLASGDKSGIVILWDPNTGQQLGKSLAGHKQWVTYLVWQPLHLSVDGVSRLLASSSKDGTIRVWDTKTGSCSRILSSHIQSITCIRWGSSSDLIYSASQDRTVKVWRVSDGALCRTLTAHSHWVNVLAMNTDFVCRTSFFDPEFAADYPTISSLDSMRAKTLAQDRVNKVLRRCNGEMMVSGSDDFTLCLWKVSGESSCKTPISRMTGHQQLINDVKFSPDGHLIASASFDKSIRLWRSHNGAFVAVLRGHVQAVFQLTWSSDSRLLVSGSADSTLKCWSASPAPATKSTGKSGSKSSLISKNCRMGHLVLDLPGHGSDVFSVDWSPDGQRVVSGSKDGLLRIWRR